jgi:hypothetical protein
MTNIENNTAALIFLYSLNRLSDLDKICDRVCAFDIFLTVGEHLKASPALTQFVNKHRHRIKYLDFHPNYGVDIAPFLKQICLIDPLQYPYFIKLHSKESTLGHYQHIDWGTILWDSLIGNEYIYRQNFGILQQAHVGAVTQPLLILNNRELNNKLKIKIICEHLGLDYSQLENTRFMAGSMFIGKTKLFHNILCPRHAYIDLLLSTESGKVDDRQYPNGTFCHAMERVFGYLVSGQGLKIHKSSLYPIIKIYNHQHKILHLHITYQNMVYLVEDFNICGSIQYKDNKYIIIKWYHLNNQKIIYKYLNDKIITKIA